jgi:hypothetical protein
VVVSAEVELHEAPAIAGGRLMFPIEQSEAVLTAYAKATQEAPEQVTLWAYLMHYPQSPAIPEEVRGKSFCIVDVITPYEPDALDGVLATIRTAGTPVADAIGPLQPSEVGELNSVPAPPQALSLITSTFDELTPELIGTLIEYGGQPSLILQVQLRHLRARGAGGRAGVAAADPAAQYMVLAVSIVPAPELQEPAVHALRSLQDALAPWRTDDMPPTGLSAWGSLRDCFSEPDLARLQEIKQRVDPDGALTGNFPLP